MYAADERVDYQNEEDLRAALEQLPSCTTRQDGTGSGDPLNFVIMGTPDEVGAALVSSGWHVTEALAAGSAWKTFKSALFGGRYRYSPMSSLYVFGRSQDAGFQKARDSIHQRNHLRLWMSPMRYRGRPVWVGAISRDIGVYFTTRAWNLSTHAIDPNTDEAREALAEDLILSQSVSRFGYVGGVDAASAEQPNRNLMNAPYWTDGVRAVFLFGDEPTAIDELAFFYWEWGDEDLNDAFNEKLQSWTGEIAPPEQVAAQAAKPVAAADASATFELVATSVAAGVGASWGKGELRFRGQKYAFEMTGVSVLEVGIVKARLGGEVYGLDRVEDFAGRYAAATAGASIGAGVGGATARNENGVVLHASSLDRGVTLSLGGGGFSITLVGAETETR
jgi:hypothetical protein